MTEKDPTWLALLKLLPQYLWPKTYNLIARVSVLTGLALMIESQVNIFQGIMVALFEEFIAKSDWLRSIVDGQTSFWVGFTVFLVGLVYHLVMSLGLEYIATLKANSPKVPEFDLQLTTKSGKSSVSGVLCLDGPLPRFNQCDDIPDYINKIDHAQVSEPLNGNLGNVTVGELRNRGFRIPGLFGNAETKTYTNKNLYRERISLLEEWLGYEPLKLSLSNLGELLATDLRVELVFPVSDYLSIKEPGVLLPDSPEKSKSNISWGVATHDYNLSELINAERKLRYSFVGDHHKITWDIEKLQAGTVLSSKRMLLFKVTGPISCKCTIFCDQLPRPVTLALQLQPSAEFKSLGLETVMDDSAFTQRYIELRAVFKE